MTKRKCAFCGHDPACGFASGFDQEPLCHTNDHSCYHLVTVWHADKKPVPQDILNKYAPEVS